MDSKQQEKELAKQLLSKLDILVKKWLDYFNQRNITLLETHDLFDSALNSFYGIGVNYIEIECIKEALAVLHLVFKEPQNDTLKNKVELVDKEFNSLFNITQSYFDDTPNAINAIAYLVNRCYKDKKELFVTLDQEKINSYIDLAEKNNKRMALWEQEKKN
jgi:hypothetical protein